MTGAGRWSEAKIAQRHRDGYGAGVLSEYKPWLTYTDGAFKGNTSQPPSRKLGRQMLFLSNIERNAYYKAEREPGLLEYWEQLPMDRDETMDIASTLAIPYPRYRYTRVPVVLTIDAVATWADRPKQVLDCKSAAKFCHMTSKNLRAITRVYALRRGWTMNSFTEESFPDTLVQNLEWMREGMDDEGSLCVPWSVVAKERHRLFRQIRCDLDRGRQEPVDHYLARHEREMKLPQNLNLIVLRQLLHEYCLDFDTETVPYRTLLAAPLTLLEAVRPPSRS